VRFEAGEVMLTTKEIDSILPFLDRFGAAGVSAGNWNNPPEEMPTCSRPHSTFMLAKR
jgi:hypothetical protein